MRALSAAIAVLSAVAGSAGPVSADPIEELDAAVREALRRLGGGRHDDRESRTRGRGAARGLAIGGTGRDPRTLEAHGLDQVAEDRRDAPAPVLQYGVELDATDALFRALGQDPDGLARRDRAAREAASIDAAAAREREGDLRRALEELPARLLDVWRDPALDPAERRQVLFELWDECAEDEHGDRARRVIEAFVRVELPAGTPQAFGAVELAALDRTRESRVAFRPYRPPR